MSVFTYPLDDTSDREKIIQLVNDLADQVGAAVTIKESLTFVTNSTRLALILGHITCDNPEHPLEGQQETPRRTRKARQARISESDAGTIRVGDWEESNNGA